MFFGGVPAAIIDYYTFYWGIWMVKSYYYLGLAYEQMANPEKARENYNKFIEIWKDVDPGREEIDDARRRLKDLIV